MNDITRILSAIEQGDSTAADQLLPQVYQELRRLAAAKLSRERPGQTLQPTVLVHEAYLRLVDSDTPQSWKGRGHFFAAAAEAMRRILVEAARRKKTQKHGGQMQRVDLELASAVEMPDDDLIALDEAMSRFEQKFPAQAALVKLRYFAGLTMPEAAAAIGVSISTAERHWRFARAWLHSQLTNVE